MSDTIRVRCIAQNAGARIRLPDGEISSTMLRRGDVVDIIDTPELHAPQYQSKEHPRGWPAHLFERVDDSVPVTRHARREGEPR